MTTVLRYSKPGNTGDNLDLILDAIRDQRVEKIVFFATPTSPAEGYGDDDGLETNLPLVAALVTGTFIGNIPIEIVLDGLFLTAARRPRYLEVRTMLDEAEKSGKAYFALDRVPFTSSLSPEDAAKTMKSLGPVSPLTPDSRRRYFSLLSGVTEKDYEQL